MNKQTSCEYCSNYIYDEEDDVYVCDIYLDEDEMSKFLSNTLNYCPHYQTNDDYKIVRKQN